MSTNMKLTDEILNRYIDNELSPEELSQFNDLLEEDEEALTKLRALKLVNGTLYEIEPDTAPHNITLNVMNKLGAVSKQVKQAKTFFNLVIGGFGLVILGVFGYMISLLDFSGEESTAVTGIVEDLSKNVNDSISLLSNFAANESVVYIGLILSAVLLVTGYFVFESHKKFKDELKSFGH